MRTEKLRKCSKARFIFFFIKPHGFPGPSQVTGSAFFVGIISLQAISKLPREIS
jgi:hypothetical protein